MPRSPITPCINGSLTRHPDNSFQALPMLHALIAIIWRELLRFISQKGRLGAALVRPLLWLFIFAAGFRAALGLSIIPPYETYITYEEYIIPGLCAMIQLFSGMQSALAMVYDREMGNMRLLLISPLPRWWLLFSKLLAGTLVSIIQVYLFLLLALPLDLYFPLAGYAMLFPMLVLNGLMLGALGLLISSLIRQLENFAGVMNFVIFPMFFLSTALYPLWRMAESSLLLRDICALNPFSHGVELIRFALYAKLNTEMFALVFAGFVVFSGLALWFYNPATSFMRKKL